MMYTTKQALFEQSNTWVLDITRQILTQMKRHTHSARARTEAEVGAFSDADAYLAEIANGMEPESFGLAHVYQCIPYANPKSSAQISKAPYSAVGW